ncbi:YceI family protein [Cryomorphaceae bacterium]|nr:YceI family protein [Cryomorphaceae bacterium]
MFWILSLLLLLPSPYRKGEEELYIKPTSYVEVHGASNVMDFSCKIGGEYFADTVRVQYEDQVERFVFRNFDFNLPVEKFACGNFVLNSDFKRTLCEEDHPVMQVRLLSFRRTRVNKVSKMDWGMLEAEFTIAGVTKIYTSEVRRGLVSEGFNMKGTLPVNMCEFGLEARSSVPLVKVEDALQVEFDFIFEQL